MAFDYRVTIKTDKYEAEIAVTTEHENATVTGSVGTVTIKQGVNDFTFTVTAEDGVTTKDYVLRVIADIVPPEAIPELDNAVKLYPNPVVDYLHLVTDIAIERVTIYDLTGRVVRQINQPANSIDLSDLSSGIYLLQATSAQGQSMQKFIKE
jgi:hypothetical protein